MGNKPQKYTKQEILNSIIFFLKSFSLIFGFWYCWHCEKFHSPFVRKVKDHRFTVCSLAPSNIQFGFSKEK